jgi:small subunit ribosomal protein S10
MLNHNNKIVRIRLKSFDYRQLDIATRSITLIAKQTGSVVKGPIPLPVKSNKITVLTSPHIDKKAREQFELRVHNRILDIYYPTAATLDSLVKLEIASGVDVQISLN